MTEVAQKNTAETAPQEVGLHTYSAPHGGLLERVVWHAHRGRLLRRYHPYFAMFDLAMLFGVGIGIVFSRHAPGLTAGGWLLIFVVEVAAYQGYLALKQRVFSIASRSFLQDTLFFLLPSYALVSYLVGHDLRASFDLVGLMFPAVLGTIRIGCFLGGCCYGRTAPWGVLYPREIFRVVRTWRTFTPGTPTSERVIPVQLFEAAVNFVLLGVLAARLVLGAPLRGHTMGWYLLGYACWRLVAESLRGTRHRPKWGPLSQAQWISLVLIPVCAWGLMTD